MPNLSRRDILKALALLLVLGLIWYYGRQAHFDRVTAESFLKSFPKTYGGLIFIPLYVILTFFIWFSKDILRFTSAILFGSVLSTVLIWIAETINAAILFYLARFSGRGFVEGLFGKKAAKTDSTLFGKNFFWLFLFRFTPLIPFRFLDLGAGLSGISFKRYLLAVALGSPVRIFWQQYVISCVGMNLLSDKNALTGYFLQNRTLLFLSVLYLVLVFLAVWKIGFKGRNKCL